MPLTPQPVIPIPFPKRIQVTEKKFHILKSSKIQFGFQALIAVSEPRQHAVLRLNALQWLKAAVFQGSMHVKAPV